MEEYYRLVINTLKQTLSDYIVAGDIDREYVSKAVRQLEFETDRRVVNNLPIEEIDALRNDLLWVICDLMGYEQEKSL